MRVKHRDLSLTYPKAIKEEKLELVLDWLLEFRFSSIGILAKRIGSNAINSNRFFNSLLNDGLIQSFKNVHTKNERYVMLTAAGVSYLEAWGRDTSHATTRIQTLGKYTQIIHDVAVQQAVLARIDDSEEVIWDRHIFLNGHDDRPDALLKNKKGYWVALEYERWRKDSKRIYMTFFSHAKALTEKHYSGVFYLFDSIRDRDYYKKLFDQESWPRYRRDKKSSRITQISATFEPDEIKNLRKCFIFSHEPVD